MKKKSKQSAALWAEFRAFMTQGNVVSLATGVVVGGAFQAIVSSLVNDLFMPIFGMITQRVDFSEAFLDLSRLRAGDVASFTSAAAAKAAGHVVVRHGAFLTAVLDFLLIGFLVFLLVKALNSVGDVGRLVRKIQTPDPDSAPEPDPERAEPETKICPFCLSSVPSPATRCAFCTSFLPEIPPISPEK